MQGRAKNVVVPPWFAENTKCLSSWAKGVSPASKDLRSHWARRFFDSATLRSEWRDFWNLEISASKRNNGRTRASLPIDLPTPRPCSAVSSVPLLTNRGSLTSAYCLLFCSQSFHIPVIIPRFSHVCQGKTLKWTIDNGQWTIKVSLCDLLKSLPKAIPQLSTVNW